MRSYLIFDIDIIGHRIEYYNHIYKRALREKDKLFYFAMPEDQLGLKESFEWPQMDNISFIKISSKQQNACTQGNYFVKQFCLSRLIANLVKEYSITDLFLITMIMPYPLLPILLPRNVNVYGIMYRIYLYEWKKERLLERFKDIITWWSIVRAKSTNSIFILNDTSSTAYLNKLYNTKKFKALPDPINPITFDLKSVRNEYGIRSEDRVYLLFGLLDQRKGTLDILKALDILDDSVLKNKVFFFSGHVSENIKIEFDYYCKKLKKKVSIIHNDEYCSYKKLANICYSADIFLAPYKNVSFSSGLVGYASNFNKIVIGPSEGLLGKIIRKYKLGINMATNDAEGLADAIVRSEKVNQICNDYAKVNTIESFCDVIFLNMCS